MKTLETERLILRKFRKEDFAAAHRYGSSVENTVYMLWGPNDEAKTREFINFAITKAEEVPCVNYQYAAELKVNGELIGACDIILEKDGCAEIGWILRRDYWKQGYGPEMGGALLDFGFGELNLRRITAHCDAENYGSYRVMEKIEMRREGMFLDGRPANKISSKKYGDELIYAILKDEWEIRREIAYYNSMPVSFDGFIGLPELSDGEIYLVCTAKNPGDAGKKLVPGYVFAICRGGEKIGDINLRIGYTDGLYFGGQIGYGIDEQHRGRGYAGRACRLLLSVAKAYHMQKLLITNDIANTASRRVCEKLGARLIRSARLPEWHDKYKEGRRFQNIFEWNIDCI